MTLLNQNGRTPLNTTLSPGFIYNVKIWTDIGYLPSMIMFVSTGMPFQVWFPLLAFGRSLRRRQVFGNIWIIIVRTVFRSFIKPISKHTPNARNYNSGTKSNKDESRKVLYLRASCSRIIVMVHGKIGNPFLL